jgi:phage-related protein (TIGR01555 family)
VRFNIFRPNLVAIEQQLESQERVEARAKAPPALPVFAHPAAQPIRVDAETLKRTDVVTYLSGIREDNLLDGLVGGANGRAGGGWRNCVTGMGTFERDKTLQSKFEEPYRIDDPQLSSLYNGNPFAQRIVTAYPNEMFRRGWCLVFGAQPDEDEEGVPRVSDPEDPSAAGQESGPAAPGTPLIDPMGGDPANTSGRAPDAPTRPQTRDNPDTAGTEPTDPKSLNNSGAGERPKVPAGNASSASTTDPSKAAPGAERAGSPDTANARPEGQPAAAGPQENTNAAKPGDGPPDDAAQAAGVDTAMKATSNRKPAPRRPAPASAEKGKGTNPADNAQDQDAGARLAKQIEEHAARLSFIPRMYEATVFGRLYGGGLLIIGADDGQDMATPLNEDGIKTIRYLAWIDRRFVFASTWYAEIGPKFGEVETWEIVNPFGGQSNTRVHESRVIRFDGAPVDFLMRRRLLGWSLSVLQAPYDTLRQYDQSFQSIANLMIDMSQAVMKINNLAQLISNDQRTLNTRMQMVDMSRSSGRMLYLDAQNEDFERAATPLTGVADVIQMQMLNVAAAAEMPVALLFGREPSGLNATGDADFRRFYDNVKGKQINYLEPKLRRAYELICKAKDSPTHGRVPPTSFTWHKLYEPTELEQSQIRWNMAQADEKYVANEILLPAEVASSRFRNGELNLDTEIDLQKRQEQLATAELPPTGAEKAKQDQENKQAEMQIKASAIAAKPGASGPPAKKPGGPPAKKLG